MLTTNRQIEALQKRADHLQARIGDSEANSYDRTELAALSSAIADLKQISAIAGLESLIDFYDHRNTKDSDKPLADCVESLNAVSRRMVLKESARTMVIRPDGEIAQLASIAATLCLQIVGRVKGGNHNR